MAATWSQGAWCFVCLVFCITRNSSCWSPTKIAALRKAATGTQKSPQHVEDLSQAVRDMIAPSSFPEDGTIDFRACLTDVDWRARFSIKPGEETGRYLPDGIGLQRFNSDGEFFNMIQPIPFVNIKLRGSFELEGRTMTLQFEEVDCKLFGFLLTTLNIREGQGVRLWIEKNIRGGRKGTKGFSKRPNIYSWIYADQQLCLARGSSGSTALWVRDDDVNASKL